MKSLRQLLRRRSRTASSEGTQPRRAEKRSTPQRAQKRQLVAQSLEQRQLLAGDAFQYNVNHNYINGNDVNRDFQISPSDALAVINHLSLQSSGALSEQVDAEPELKLDVNNDGLITPSDALATINAMARGEGMTPLVEYFITARDLNDNELVADGNGVIDVGGTGQENSFFLEVAYADLRTLGGDLGVFSIFPDIGVSEGGILRPVLRETQQIIFDTAIRQTTAGSMTIGSEGTTDTFNIPLGTVLSPDDFILELESILGQLGYNAGDFAVSRPSGLNPPNGDLGYEIRYTGADVGNVDLPDLTVSQNFDNNAQVTFREFAPEVLVDDPNNPTGPQILVPNSEAVRFNLNTESRTLNDGDDFYDSLNRGNFDLTTGFTDIGGVGGTQNVREAADNGRLTEPFDAFSIEVFLASAPSTPLDVDVNPGVGVDPLLIYGSNDQVPDDLITIGDGATVSLSAGGVVDQPVTLTTTPLTQTVTEDDADTSFSLVEGASDPEGQAISVTGFAVMSGNAAGVTQNGNSIDVTPSSYNFLATGESEVVVLAYGITDGTTTATQQTLSLTVTGANDAPVVSATIDITRTEDQAAFNLDLLQNASDPDTNDTLDATSITLDSVTGGDASGFTVDDANNQISIDPTVYDSLDSGQEVVATYSYDVTDGNGGTVSTSAVVTITGITDGPNNPPTVGDPVTVSLSEDDAAATLNLLTGAADADGDTLSVTGLTLRSGDASGITDNGNTLSIDPSAYNSLASTDSAVIIYDFTVTDGRTNGDVAQSATITIGGVNDAPVVGAAVMGAFTEDGAISNVNLLMGASDVDTGDTLSVANLVRVTGDDSGISQNGNSLIVDPTGYDSLAAGATEQISYTYDVTDGIASTAQTATITITGINDAPTVGNPITATFSEDDASSTVQLLTGAADVDNGDTLSVSDFTVASGDASGITQSGNAIDVDPNAYNALPAGQSEVVTINFNVTDGNGGSTAQTATVTITGANDAPVVSAAISETRTEDDADFTVDLLGNASDPDTGDTLSITNLSTEVLAGTDAGITLNGTSVNVTPSTYNSLNPGESAQVRFTYQVTDGTATTTATTATITITGLDEGVPVVSDVITVSFDEDDANATVDLLQNASDPDGDTLNIANAVITSGDASGVTIDAANNRLVITPSAYNDLNTGQSAVVVVTYDVTDGSNSVSTTATVTIVGEDEPLISGSTISGSLYIDSINNMSEVLAGTAAPVRDGIQQDDEDAIGGVTVRLMQVTAEGEQEVARVLTTNSGAYEFTEVDPGSYFVEYDLPESISFTGSTRGQVVVDPAGGQSLSGPELNAVGMTGTLSRLDLLARSYVASGVMNTTDNPDGLNGGTVQLTSDGNQAMFVAGDGFDEVNYAEVVINEARDAALLSIIDSNGVVMTARLSSDQFITTSDGMGVRFFGALSDFDFAETNAELIRSEFANYRNAIDQVLAGGV